MPDDVLDAQGEDAREAVCPDCRRKELGEALQADMMETLEEKLGLAEQHRDALRSFIETIFTDPAKILRVQDLDNRVRSLERQIVILWAIIGGIVVALLVAVAGFIVAVA